MNHWRLAKAWHNLEAHWDTSNIVREITGRHQLSIVDRSANHIEAATFQVLIWLKAILDHQRSVFQCLEKALERRNLLHYELLFATVSLILEIGNKTIKHRERRPGRLKLERVVAQTLLAGLRLLHFQSYHLSSNSSSKFQVIIQDWLDRVSDGAKKCSRGMWESCEVDYSRYKRLCVRHTAFIITWRWISTAIRSKGE